MISLSPRQCIRTLFLVLVILWNIVFLSHSNKQVTRVSSDTRQAAVQVEENPRTDPEMGRCESPSLPRGSFHIVVGGYKYAELESGIGFDVDDNYLLELGLTNADIFWYRRERPNEPLREVQGPCGIHLKERLLLPNYGREGAAFFDHILEIYDSPPASIVFLHGHAAHAWHTSCESVFARTTYVYRDLTQSFLTRSHRSDHNNTVRNHMMTLTSRMDGTSNADFRQWYGHRKTNDTKRPGFQHDMAGSSNRRRLEAESSSSSNNSSNNKNQTKITPCSMFLERWKDTLAPYTRRPPRHQSCCASFVLPGGRIHRFPRMFYEELQAVQKYQGYPDSSTGRHCFEFLIYRLFGDQHGEFTDEQYQTFYDQADGLVHERFTKEGAKLKPDKDVLVRMESCTHPNPKVMSETWKQDRLYVIKRKWRNSWKHLGFYGGYNTEKKPGEMEG